MNYTDLTCIRCDSKIESAILRDIEDPPPSGTIFFSHGNYGSTVWDEPMGRDCLVVMVCDDCLLTAGRGGNVMLTQPVPVRTTTTRKPWKPDERRDESSD